MLQPEIHVLKIPEQSQWQARLLGGSSPVVYIPAKGSEPNAFHRFMQRLCFGVVWEKRNEP